MKKKIEISLVAVEIVMIGILIFLVTSNLIEIWNALWKIMLFFAFVYFAYLFIRIHFSERKILALYKERDEKIAEIEKQTVAMNVIDGRTRREELNFQGKISSLERQRKYDLEKIPFLKN
ncbi:MAG: hypothetical protein WCI36_01150 [bacterium]